MSDARKSSRTNLFIYFDLFNFFAYCLRIHNFIGPFNSNAGMTVLLRFKKIQRKFYFVNTNGKK